MIKEAAQFSIQHILGSDTTSKELFYKIPPYQREYTWGKDNWENLYNDLFEAEKGYFLGSIICIDDDQIHPNKKILQVIDGQQRLTTISILLAALYSAIQNLINQDQTLQLKLFQDRNLNINWLKIQSMLRFNDSSQNNDENRLTLSIQKNNQDDFIYLLNTVFNINELPIKPKYYDLRAISKAYKYFLEKFEEVDESGEKVNSLYSLFEHFEKICTAIVVRISVDSMQSAFVLFESINNRGVPLTPIDLIKNMIISSLVKNSQDADHINERWQTIVRNVESYDDQVRFLRHFYHAYKSNPAIGLSKYTKATKTNIIRIYTTLIENNSQYILNQLIEKSNVYAAIISPEKIELGEKFAQYKALLLNLKRVKSVPANALILYLLTHFEEQDLTEILTYLETWFIRRHVTNYPTTNKLDQIFLEVIEQLQEKKLFLDETKEAKDEKKQQELHARKVNALQEIKLNLNKMITKNSRAEFINQLLTVPLYEDNPEATRSLLIKLEKLSRTKEQQVDFWQKSDSNKLIWSIEHVCPQKPLAQSHWCQEIAEEDRMLWIHTLGNLTLTCYNSSLSNSDYKTKCDAIDKKTNLPIGLKSGNVYLNQDFIQTDHWGIEQIKRRGERLANAFASLFD